MCNIIQIKLNISSILDSQRFSRFSFGENQYYQFQRQEGLGKFINAGIFEYKP